MTPTREPFVENPSETTPAYPPWVKTLVLSRWGSSTGIPQERTHLGIPYWGPTLLIQPWGPPIGLILGTPGEHHDLGPPEGQPLRTAFVEPHWGTPWGTPPANQHCKPHTGDTPKELLLLNPPWDFPVDHPGGHHWLDTLLVYSPGDPTKGPTLGTKTRDTTRTSVVYQTRGPSWEHPGDPHTGTTLGTPRGDPTWGTSHGENRWEPTCRHNMEDHPGDLPWVFPLGTPSGDSPGSPTKVTQL